MLYICNISYNSLLLPALQIILWAIDSFTLSEINKLNSNSSNLQTSPNWFIFSKRGWTVEPWTMKECFGPDFFFMFLFSSDLHRLQHCPGLLGPTEAINTIGQALMHCW